jgi:hypothetical protein
MQFVINFTNDISLIYDLVDEEITYQWLSIISSRSISDLCPINHYVGYISEEKIQAKIHRLYELSDLINEHAPDRVIKQDITKESWRVALHVMHVHFPELKNDIAYSHIWPLLTEYNDIIHWLESKLLNVWSNKSNMSESSLFRITLDFNKSNPVFLPIPDSAYKLFDPYSLFGELKLHYTHVGKHAQELFIARDMTCPSEQFVPQRTFTASVRLLFTDDFKRNDEMASWSRYYNSRGKDFWNIDINDPKIAFGYMKIGQLNSIIIDGKMVEIPTTMQTRHEFRKKLVDTTVIGWEIK